MRCPWSRVFILAVILSTSKDDQACLSFPLSKSRYASLSLLRIFTLTAVTSAQREKRQQCASLLSINQVEEVRSISSLRTTVCSLLITTRQSENVLVCFLSTARLLHLLAIKTTPDAAHFMHETCTESRKASWDVRCTLITTLNTLS